MCFDSIRLAKIQSDRTILIRALDSELVPRDPSTAACIRPKHTPPIKATT